MVQQVRSHELDPALERRESLCVGGRLASEDARDLVALLEQERREERAVLPADARDQGVSTPGHDGVRTAWPIVPTSGSRSNPPDATSSRNARATPGYVVP